MQQVVYEFYYRDKKRKEHFLGILPERRKNPHRMTRESVFNWGWKVIGDQPDVNDIYFVQVEI